MEAVPTGLASNQNLGLIVSLGRVAMKNVSLLAATRMERVIHSTPNSSWRSSPEKIVPNNM